MKNILFLIIAILSASTALFSQSVKNMNTEDFQKKLDSTPDKIILDVRTEKEFSQGHLTGATQLDYYKNDFKQKLGKLDKTKPVFVYCLAGGRSSSASSIMAEMGFVNVYNLEGGYKAWSAAKKPVAK